MGAGALAVRALTGVNATAVRFLARHQLSLAG